MLSGNHISALRSQPFGSQNATLGFTIANFIANFLKLRTFLTRVGGFCEQNKAPKGHNVKGTERMVCKHEVHM